MPRNEMPPAQPLCVLGAPCQGLRLVGDAVVERGIHLGHDIGASGGSHFFADLNRFALRTAHAEWDVPEPLEWTLDDEPVAEALTEELRQRCAAGKTRGFLGWKGSLRSRSLLTLEGEWGWLDARTTLLLPLWLRVFPRLRVLHVLQNGVDVALALAAREQERHADLKCGARSARCADPRRAFDVWAQYVEAGLRWTEALPPERVQHVRLEDGVHDAGILETALRRLGVSEGEEPASFDVPRPHAFRETEAGWELYGAVASHPLMKRLEYHDLAKQAS